MTKSTTTTLLHSWTAKIATLAKQGQTKEALKLFSELHESGSNIRPDHFAYSAVLKVFGTPGVLGGRDVHGDLIKRGFEGDTVVCNALIEMYGKCHNDMSDALQVFDKMPNPDAVSWSIIISALVYHDQNEEALHMLKKMIGVGKMPHSVMVLNIMPACGRLGVEEIVHGFVLKCGLLSSDVFVGNAFVDMYAKNGRMSDALHVFEELPSLDLASWNSLLFGYAMNSSYSEAVELFRRIPRPNVISVNSMVLGCLEMGFFEEALEFLRQMNFQGIAPNVSSFASALRATSKLGCLQHGQELHSSVLRSGFMDDASLGMTLIDMYSKCKSIDDACKVFENMLVHDVSTLNGMLSGYLENGLVEKAYELFETMSIRNEVSWNIMIAGFAKNGHVDKAFKLFDNMADKDVVSWNTMIGAFGQNGFSLEASVIFQRMMELGALKPDYATFANVLSVCVDMGGLQQGKEVHGSVLRHCFHCLVSVSNCLIHMYSQCGNLDYALWVFQSMQEKNVISWNTMIAGYATHGFANEACLLFHEMAKNGIKPNSATFVALLSACRHRGLVDKGRVYFDSMETEYQLTPTMEHYFCIVDLLGRAGRLREAHEFVERMPIKPDSIVWESLLTSCRNQNNIEMAELVTEKISQLKPLNAAHYVLLSNVYAQTNRWDDKVKIRQKMEES